MPCLDHDLIPIDVYEKIFKAGFRGVFMGGCVTRGEGSNIRRSGHCHTSLKNGDRKWTGWICIKSRKPEKLVKDGKLTKLFLHELAHVLAPDDHKHGKKFCEALILLGGSKFKHDYAYITKNLKRIRAKRKV